MKKNNFLGTLIFATIVIGVGGFALFEFKKQKVEVEVGATSKNLLKDFKSSEVTEISVKGSLAQIELKKEGGDWLVVAPISDLAD